MNLIGFAGGRILPGDAASGMAIPGEAYPAHLSGVHSQNGKCLPNLSAASEAS